ncbi:type II/IV secretion system ATPase subunit [Haloglomus litoreum]|uniref:type II/IV secretion system ATPase subunit n=1 Tax=Haloglomus litoreum TaxID=3034026 RepID=UPI0023E868EF|nr:type II/IV secretion system ATPase subunit [Haloglomus sp. DT116]
MTDEEAADAEPAPRQAIRRVGGDEDVVEPEPEPATEPVHPTVEAVLEDVREYFRAGGGDPFGAPDDEFVEESFFDFSYLERYEEVDRRWVNEPFAFISILYDAERNEYQYRVVEPTLDLFEQYVRADLITLLRNELIYMDFEPGNREGAFMAQARDLVDEHAATVDPGTLHKVVYYLRRDFLGFGPIDPIMRDSAIEDISCDGTEVPVYVYHREYRDLPSNVSFSERKLNSFVVQLAQRAGRSVSIASPLVDASLPDGSRIQLTLGGDISTRGANFTIRKFADVPYTPVDLIEWNTFSVEQMAYFWLAIENNKSLIFAGGTGSGKTTSMNAVSFFIPQHSKVVTIEDTREIDLPHENWVQSVTRSSASGEGRGEVTMYNLLQAALRQRPEYLLVGEIRTEQNVALTFFQAMGTGHTAYTTIHADSVETALSRLQNPPLSIPTQMLQDLDVISIQRQTFLGDRRVRRNATVAELSGDETQPDRVDWTDIFEWDPETDTHERVGESDVLLQIARERGWTDEQLAGEFQARQRVLEYLVEENIHGYNDVATAIQAYARNPDEVLEAIEAGTFDPAEFDSARAEDNRTAVHDAIAADDVAPRGTGLPPELDAATYEEVLAAAAETADADLEELGDERPAGGLTEAADGGNTEDDSNADERVEGDR